MAARCGPAGPVRPGARLVVEVRRGGGSQLTAARARCPARLRRRGPGSLLTPYVPAGHVSEMPAEPALAGCHGGRGDHNTSNLRRPRSVSCGSVPGGRTGRPLAAPQPGLSAWRYTLALRRVRAGRSLWLRRLSEVFAVTGPCARPVVEATVQQRPLVILNYRVTSGQSAACRVTR